MCYVLLICNIWYNKHVAEKGCFDFFVLGLKIDLIINYIMTPIYISVKLNSISWSRLFSLRKSLEVSGGGIHDVLVYSVLERLDNVMN